MSKGEGERRRRQNEGPSPARKGTSQELMLLQGHRHFEHDTGWKALRTKPASQFSNHQFKDETQKLSSELQQCSCGRRHPCPSLGGKHPSLFICTELEASTASCRCLLLDVTRVIIKLPFRCALHIYIWLCPSFFFLFSFFSFLGEGRSVGREQNTNQKQFVSSQIKSVPVR